MVVLGFALQPPEVEQSPPSGRTHFAFSIESERPVQNTVWPGVLGPSVVEKTWSASTKLRAYCQQFRICCSV
jgi:hypothetical protein